MDNAPNWHERHRTENLPNRSTYADFLLCQKNHTLLIHEERAPRLKGLWREYMGIGSEEPLDLELGTGRGDHFAHFLSIEENRSLVGLEIKYKPLVQTFRRAFAARESRFALVRYNAHRLEALFEPKELDDIYLFFPDPWPKKRHWKNRLVQEDWCFRLRERQRPGSKVYLKTDNEDYFDYASIRFLRSGYLLSHSERPSFDVPTQFETIFTQKGLPIFKAVFLR